MHLDEIAAMLRGRGAADLIPGAGSGTGTDIVDLAYDSHRVVAGSLFFCLRGGTEDGHRHVPAALAAGARAIVCERPMDVAAAQIVVPNARTAMSALAAPFFGYPSRRLALAGVTGTNGKTTVAYMLEGIFAAAGKTTGLIGTVQTRFPGFSSGAIRTTPESVDLQRLLAQMVQAEVGACAMEVTSIGLAQGRVAGAEFRCAIFTNLTQDHLDYHGDLESYYRAKRALFTPEFLPFASSVAVVNLDDAFGVRLASEIAHDDVALRCLTFGQQPEANLRAIEVQRAPRGSRFRILAAAGAVADMAIEELVDLPLPGAFNVSNALGAAAAAAALGMPPGAIAAGLSSLGPIPGRFQLVDEGQDFTVAVDYAHTPDGLQRVLAAARELAGSPRGRVIAVFGCGGDRDRGKRPLMGQVAGAGADVVYVTSDNPRGENPEAIIAEIAEGIRQSPPPQGYHLLADREAAIDAAVAGAGAGDVVVIAGKGHETTQTFATQVVSFDDRMVAAASLRRRDRGAVTPP
jgi:UDP-N-acetylmuramoyl-L-alanyl-D-glutamate--2,6-diaminopimelate ligase